MAEAEGPPMTTNDVDLAELARLESQVRLLTEERDNLQRERLRALNAAYALTLDTILQLTKDRDNARRELLGVREAWERERAGYDETCRVLAQRRAEATVNAQEYTSNLEAVLSTNADLVKELEALADAVEAQTLMVCNAHTCNSPDMVSARVATKLALDRAKKVLGG